MFAERVRLAVSEGSENGMLIAADYLEENGDETDVKLGLLLRNYVNILTYVRMSQPIPLDMAEQSKQLQSAFNTPDHKRADPSNYGCHYRKPLGPYYTALDATQRAIIASMDLISQEPIRELTITEGDVNDETGMILRNYRVDYMYTLTYRFIHQRSNISALAKAVMEMKASQMHSFTIIGVNDRLKTVQAAFLSNRNIRKGCELLIASRLYETPRRVQIKK